MSRNILSQAATPKSRERLLKWHNTRKFAYRVYFLLGDYGLECWSQCAWDGGGGGEKQGPD